MQLRIIIINTEVAHLHSRLEKSPSKAMQQIEQLRLLYELHLYSLQRIACLGLAIWVFLQTGDITKFVTILATGFINVQWAMKLLAGAITNAISATKTGTSQD